MRGSLQTVLAGAVVAAAGSSAYADHFEAHFTLVGNAAVTDNANSAAENTGTDPKADIFFQARPGVLLGYETPRVLQELDAEIEAIAYARGTQNPTADAHGGYHLLWTASPRSTVDVTANGTIGRTSTLSSFASPDQTTVGATVPTVVDVRQASASEVYRYQLSQASTFFQTLHGTFSDSNDQTSQDLTTYEGGASLGYDHNWRANALTLELGASILRLQRLGPADGPLGFDTQANEVDPRGRLSWRHDYNRRWSSQLSAGMLVVLPYGTDPYNPDAAARPTQEYPTGTAAVAYTDAWGRAQLTAGHDVAPNFFLAQNTENDFALLQAVMPLWFSGNKRQAPQFLGAASLGYAHSKFIDQATAIPLDTVDVYHVDVGVTYFPHPGLAYSARAEYFRQEASENASAMAGTFGRATLYLSVLYRWPATVTVQTPRKSQNESVRADGADTAPVGQEQVVPTDDSNQPVDQRGGGAGGVQPGPGTGGVTGPGEGSSPGLSGGVNGAGPP